MSFKPIGMRQGRRASLAKRMSIGRPLTPPPESGTQYNEMHEIPEGFSMEYKPNPPHLDGIADMSRLIYLEEDNVVHNLTCRYAIRDIYTNVSSILIAVNPYELLPIYGKEKMEKYRALPRHKLVSLPPHCYQVAELAYQTLAKTGKNQSMVICGESGSGKTESAKTFMRFLANACSRSEEKKEDISIEDQFLETNPIMEAFGNAQTILNNNSSRFGKFTKVLFQGDSTSVGERMKVERPRIIGTVFETYLLEKSRVVKQARGERNYHCFYEMARGLPANLIEEYGVKDVDSFHYLNQSGVTKIPGVSDEEKFTELDEALKKLKFTEEQRAGVWKQLAGILHLGNIEFDNSNPDSVVIDQKTHTHLEYAAKLLGVPTAKLEARLTSRSLKAGRQTIVKPLTEQEAPYNRDAIGKKLYHGLFLFIVLHVNHELCTQSKEKELFWIGILDVFGFEYSDWDNSFEQLCINWANERLQGFFNNNVIQTEQDEYLREGLPWTKIPVPDNSPMISLIEDKPVGLIAQLDSVCVMPKGTDEVWMQNVFQVHRKHPKIKYARVRKLPSTASAKAKAQLAAERARRRGQHEKFSGFTILHYAGEVTYNSKGFLDKNADAIHPDTIALFGASSNLTVKYSVDPPADKLAPGVRKKVQRKTFLSVGTTFGKQLGELMDMLGQTHPYFVRCINPNQFKRPQTLDQEYVRPQLRCGGLVEALRILKLGFPSRVPYSAIYERFGHVIPSLADAKDDTMRQRDFAEAVFVAFGLEKKEYRLGFTKVFFRPGKQQFLETVLKETKDLSPEMVSKIQQLLIKRRVRRMRAGLVTLARIQMAVDCTRALKRLRNACHVAHVVARVITKPLLKVYKLRAVHSIQAYFRTVLERRRLATRKAAALTIQAARRWCHRRKAVTKKLNELVEKRRAERNAAAANVQAFWRHNHRRRMLIGELERRVEATRVRKEYEAKMEQERREAEERQRQRKLEEERQRLLREEEERRRKAEEERLRKLEEERLRQEAANKVERERREAEERERQRLLAIEQAKLAEAERQRQEAERRRKEEEDRILEAQRRKEEERRAKEEADRRRRQKQREWEEARAHEEAERKAEAEREQLLLETEQALAAAAAEDSAYEARKAQARERSAQLRAQGLIQASCQHCQVVFVKPVKSDKTLCGKCQDFAQKLEMLEWRIQNQLNIDSGDGPLPGLLQADQPPPIKEEPEVEKGPKPKPPVGPPPKHVLEAFQQQMRHVLLQGFKFLKYGKRGKPHIRHVCANSIGHLHWDKVQMDPRQLRPSDTFIKLRDVTKIMKGKQTAILQRKVAQMAPSHLCFSVCTGDRTLDFQAVDVEQRDLWVRALTSVVKEVKSGLRNLATGAFLSDEVEEEKVPGEEEKPAEPEEEPEELIPPVTDAFGDELLENGEQLLKFGRSGKPHKRWVNCTLMKLYWGTKPRPSRAFDKIPAFIELANVMRVVPGKETEILQRKSNDKVDANTCFSLVLKLRTVDFQCDSQERRDCWVDGLRAAVLRSKRAAHDQWLARKRQKAVNFRRSFTAGNLDQMGRARAATTAMGGPPPGSRRYTPLDVQEMEDMEGLPVVEEDGEEHIGPLSEDAKMRERVKMLRRQSQEMAAQTLGANLARMRSSSQFPEGGAAGEEEARTRVRTQTVAYSRKDSQRSLPAPPQVTSSEQRRKDRLRMAGQAFGLPEKFVKPGRRLVSQGTLVKRCKRKFENYHFILFTDLLVYASGQQQKLVLHQQIPIDERFSVEDHPDEVGKPKAGFKINNRVKNLIVYAKTEQEKKYWMEDLVYCMNKRTAHH